MALRAFVWVICVGCERVRVVVSEGKALLRYWWHAGKCVDDFRAAAPKGVAGRVSVSRLYAEPRGAEPRGAGRRRGSPSGCPHPASPPTASLRTPWPSGLLKGSTTRAPCHPFRAITTREHHPPDSTKSPQYVLVIRGHSCPSAVMLFGGLLNETAVPRINANARRSPGAARRIVVYDHPIKVFAGHPRAFVLIGGEVVRRAPERNCFAADQRQCPPIARRGATDRRTRPSHQCMCWSSAGIRAHRR